MATKNALLIKIRDMKGFFCSRNTHKKCQHELPAQTSFLSSISRLVYSLLSKINVLITHLCHINCDDQTILLEIVKLKNLIKQWANLMNLSKNFPQISSHCFSQIFSHVVDWSAECWSQLKRDDFTHGKMISKDMRRISNGKLNHMKCSSQCEC